MRDDATPDSGDDAQNDAVKRTNPGDGTSLPYARAFVVQFTAETDGGLEHAAGRVEHLLTGRRERFESVDDLLLWIVALLPRPPDTSGQ
jgi:hypothetical protein